MEVSFEYARDLVLVGDDHLIGRTLIKDIMYSVTRPLNDKEIKHVKEDIIQELEQLIKEISQSNIPQRLEEK